MFSATFMEVLPRVPFTQPRDGVIKVSRSGTAREVGQVSRVWS